MSSVNTSECIICYNEYDWEKRKPCVGTCGHSICESCKHHMNSSKCPQCNRDEAFAITTINYQVLELMKQFQNIRTGASSGESSKTLNDEMKSLEEGLCSDCQCRSKKLRICTDCATAKGILVLIAGTISLNLDGCSIEQAIMKARAVSICGDCVLDGSHGNHKTIPLSQLKKDLDSLVVQNVQTNMDSFEELCKTEMGKTEKRLKEAFEKLNKYFKLGENIPMDEKKAHYNNVEALLEQLRIAVEMVKDTAKRLTVTELEIDKQAVYVKNNSKSFQKRLHFLTNAEPTLVADRKQSAREPLLIGVFEPKTSNWISVGRMPNPKSNYAVASLLGKIFIIGGMNNGNWLPSLELYDREKNLRRDCSKMKKGRTRTSAGFHNGKLYVCGGYDGGYMNSVEIYDPETNEWVDGPNLDRARADAAVVSCNDALYVLGGYNGKEYEEKIERLNEETNKFEVVGDMNGSRAGFGCCVFMGRIYVAGGWSNSNNTLKTCRSFDPLLNSWRDEPSMIKDRKYFSLHSTSEAVYAIRGCADSWSLIPEIEKLNRDTGKWDVIQCVQQLGTSTPQMNPANQGATA